MSGPLQWTPNGMVPVGSPSAVALTAASRVSTDEEDDDVDDPEDLTSVPRRPSPAFGPKSKAAPKSRPLTPKNLVSQAKARLREVNTELKRMKRLEAERDELERLVAAAKSKPLATVRELPKRSAG